MKFLNKEIWGVYLCSQSLSNRQTTMALLYKEKFNLKTGESVVQLNKLNKEAKQEVAPTEIK